MRAYVIGLDGLCPKLVEIFAEDGTCPNFRKVMESGGFSRSISAIPAQTPENWTTIATGARPGTHGIAVWGTHRYGDPVTERHGPEAMSSNLCRAEYLWEAAARQGLGSVLQYFVGYPPTTERTIHVDWIGWHPGEYYFEFSPSAVYVQDGKERAGGGDVIPVKFSEAGSWENLPRSYSTPLEAKLNLSSNNGDRGFMYHMILIDPDDAGYQLCAISRSRDFSDALCNLREGDWSDWVEEKLEGGKGRINVRFKLMELSGDGNVFRLYRSQAYPASGFTYPPEAGEELIDRFGPYINEGAAGMFFKGLVDREVFADEYSYQTKWIYRSSTYLMEKHDASVYFLHWHLPDFLGHQVLGDLDPSGGDYHREKADEAWEVMRLGYGIADSMVGDFLSRADDETYLFVISDHGSATNRKTYPIVEDLAERGLIEIEDRGGAREIDWDRSKIFIDLTNIYVNLEGRYSGGVVSESEYEDVREDVIDVLRSCRDQDGEYVISFALKREDAPVVGLWGPGVGDVVFTYSPGFTWGNRLTGEKASVPTGGANHGPQIPTAETGFSSNYATFMLVGGKAKRGYRRPEESLGPVQLVDIAPTISHILGIDPPRHSQGAVLHDFFEGWDVSESERTRQGIETPDEVTLEGDVTDTMLR
jgi:predicted AlkP superfamily phosphohydrolase/phosphomutase